MLKFNKKEMWKREAKISYFEIFILLIATFSFAYLINYKESRNNNIINTGQIGESKNNNHSTIISNFLKAWIERSRILSLVSAEEQDNPLNYNYEVFGGFQQQAAGALSMSCCPRLNNSATCQDILTSNCEAMCPGGCLPTKCEQTSTCKLGCCVDTDEGNCAVNTPKDSCSSLNGTWIDDASCNNPVCKNACCVLGSQSFFTTEKRCEKISSFYGLDKDFRKAISTEVACIALSYSQEEGACLIKTDKENGCRFSTKSECVGLTKDARNFYKGYLCSNPALNTSCVKEVKTGCVTGKDGVYWFDSCGNRENIYSSDKTASWNGGIILSLAQSCNPNVGNINSLNCGNCDYFQGSICSKADSTTSKPAFGDYVCKDLNCHNAPDNVGVKDRKNGEAWCVYDGFVGDGKDVVGSRDWKYYCIDGQVKVEPCGDFRTGICVQSESDTPGGEFSSAACRPNRAMECISYNSKEENNDEAKLKEECEENSDCQVRNFNFGKGYEFSVCTPRYPPGFDMKDNAEMGEKICNQADFTCKKMEVKEYTGWKCVAGCECDSKKFTQSMNDYCVSLGDCGGYVNVLGKTDPKGYSISGAPNISVEQYKNYSNAIKGQFADPGDFSGQLAAAYGWGASSVQGGQNIPSDPTMMLGLGSAGVGLIGSGMTTSTGTAIVGATAAAFSGALIAAGIMAGVGLMISQFMGLQGQGTLFMTGGGALIGLGAGAALIAGAAIATATATASTAATMVSMSFVGMGMNPAIAVFMSYGVSATLAPAAPLVMVPVVGWILAGVGVAVIALTIALGVGEVKETKVTFNCNTYQPPKGGSDCSKCNTDEKLTGDGFKECSKYRCQSLGQTCEFINAGTGNEACINNNPNDVSAPLISKGDYITPGFSYANVSSNGFSILASEGNCIPEFSPVIYGIKTDEAAQCKYDVVHTNNYDEMQFYVGDTSLYINNHTIALLLPSMDALLNELKGNMSEAELANLASVLRQKTGDMNFFVRCEDKNGNSNIKEFAIRTCVKPGDDLTPPYIPISFPLSGSYLKFGETQKNLTVYVNEPAECRYSLNDLQYQNMNNSFTCLTGLQDVAMNGWACYANVSGLNLPENNVYIKCVDQPWLANTENESKRNPMHQSAIVKLLSSKSELKIANIIPNSTIFVGQEPTTIVAELDTSGGANDKAACSYSFTGNNYIPFFNTFDKHHSQTFSLMLSGSYTLYIKCEDEAGNIAEGETSFIVDVDENSPLIQRVYKNQNKLYITTQENANCVYSTLDCEYNFENGTVMAGTDKQHTADWIPGGKYFIKCKDKYENEPLGCTITVKADEVQSV